MLLKRYLCALLFVITTQCVYPMQPAHAQASLLKMFLMDMGKGGTFQSAEQKKRTALQERLSQLRAESELELKQRASLEQSLQQEIRYYRKQALGYRTQARRAKHSTNKQLMYHRLGRVADTCVDLLMGLQVARSSREQSRRKLQGVLESYLETLNQMRKLLQTRYPPSQIISLRQHTDKLQKQKKTLDSQAKQDEQTLQKSRESLEKAQRTFSTLRRVLMRNEQGQTTSRPTSQPTKHHLLDFRYKILQFHKARLRVRLYELRHKDEKLEFESYQLQQAQLQDMLKKMLAWSKRISRQAEGGLLYRKWPKWFGNSAYQPKTSLIQALALKKQSSGLQRASTKWSVGFWLIIIVSLLVSLFFVVWFVFFLGRLQGHVTDEAPPWMRPLHFLLYILKGTLPWFYVCLILTALLFLSQSSAKQRDVWLGLLTWILLMRSLWLAIGMMFSKSQNERIFQEIAEHRVTVFRRTLRVLVLLWCIPFALVQPFGQSPALLPYPMWFFGVQWLLTLVLWGVLCIRKDDLIQMLPRENTLQRVLILLMYYLYPIFALLPFISFGLYCAGYQNLSQFILSNIFWTLVLWLTIGWVMECIQDFFETLRGASQVQAPPTPELPAADVDIDEKHAASTPAPTILVESRLPTQLKSWLTFVNTLHLLTYLLLWISVVGLLLEIWDVPGGFLALWYMMQTSLFQVQNTHITLWSLVRMSLTVGIAIWLTRWAPIILDNTIYATFEVSEPVQYATNTLITYTFILAGLLVGFQWMGVGLGGVFLALGIIGLSIGFGLRNIANHFLSSLIIIYGRPFVVGDFIQVGPLEGRVREITARSTLIETPNKRILMIPNANLLNDKIINWTKKYPYVRARVDIYVSYKSDMEKVESVLSEIAQANKGVLPTPGPKVRLRNLDTNHMQYGLTGSVSDHIVRFRILSELRKEAVRRFAEEGIELAMPERRLHIASEDTLPLAKEAPLVIDE